MEPDLEVQYDSISQYVAHRLVMMANQDEHEAERDREKKQVNVRIPLYAYDDLVTLAADLGETPTGLAADLLQLAIHEASGVQLVGKAEE